MSFSSVLLAAPGPHPDAETLRQYAAGALAPAAEQRIEAHALDCERCTDILEGMQMSDAPTTDRAVAELRARLQKRVRDAAPLPVARPGGSYQLWPRLAAAAAVAGLAAAGLWGWEHRAPTSEPLLARTETAAPAGTPPPAAEAEPPAPAVADAAPATAEAVAPAVPLVAAPPAPAQVATGRRSGRAARAMATDTVPDLLTSSSLASTGASSGSTAAAQPDFALNEAPTEEKAAFDKGEKEVAAAPASPAPSVAATTGRSETAKGSEAPAKAKAMMQEADPRRAVPMPAGPTLAPAATGGILALREYLRREASNFDPAPNASRLSGSIRIRFMVGETGKLSDVKVVRGLRADYDAEALRIVCDGPAWQPGVAGGRRAALPVELTVPF